MRLYKYPDPYQSFTPRFKNHWWFPNSLSLYFLLDIPIPPIIHSFIHLCTWFHEFWKVSLSYNMQFSFLNGGETERNFNLLFQYRCIHWLIPCVPWPGIQPQLCISTRCSNQPSSLTSVMRLLLFTLCSHTGFSVLWSCPHCSSGTSFLSNKKTPTLVTPLPWSGIRLFFFFSFFGLYE